MDAVFRRLSLKDAQEQQARLTQGRHDQYRVVLGHVAGPDLALEQRAPERGERVRVARVEGDLVNLQRSIFAVGHGFQRTTCRVHCRIKYVRLCLAFFTRPMPVPAPLTTTMSGEFMFFPSGRES